MEQEYSGTYGVYKVFFKSRRRVFLEGGLTREQAKSKVAGYPDRKASMVVFDKES